MLMMRSIRVSQCQMQGCTVLLMRHLNVREDQHGPLARRPGFVPEARRLPPWRRQGPYLLPRPRLQAVIPGGMATPAVRMAQVVEDRIMVGNLLIRVAMAVFLRLAVRQAVAAMVHRIVTTPQTVVALALARSQRRRNRGTPHPATKVTAAEEGTLALVETIVRKRTCHQARTTAALSVSYTHLRAHET